MGHQEKIQKELTAVFAKRGFVKRKDIRKVLIVAGTARQANFVAKENGWEDWEYIHDPQQLSGKHGVRVTFYGNYWENKNQRRIREIVEHLISEGRAEEV